MNVEEGAHRMQTAGRWIFLADCALAICLVGVQVACSRYGIFAGGPFIVILPLLIPLTLFGAALWVAGWIVEGFSKDAN